MYSNIRDAQNQQEANAMEKFREDLFNQRDQFTAANQLVVDQNNAVWRREINTAETANQNAANQQNAQNAFAMTSQSLSFLWQELRDQADFDFREAENAKNREKYFAPILNLGIGYPF